MIDFEAMLKYYACSHQSIFIPLSLAECENGWYSLGFPFLYTDNDGIEIYVQKCPDGTILMTDDGWTLGVHSCFDRRNIEVVKRIVNHNDYSRYDEETDAITATATEECFAPALLELISVIIATNYAAMALHGMKVMKNADQDDRKE